MMFVALLPEEAPDKTEWSSKDIEVLTKKWRAVRTGGRREGCAAMCDILLTCPIIS